MSKLLSISIFFSLFIGLNLNATEHIITTSGITYTPATLEAAVGDTVTFVIGSNHPTVEVSQATWDANQATPLSGGFGSFSSEFSIEITALMAPTVYYVCSNHVGGGMKGQINVLISGVEEITNEIDFKFGPNPVKGNQINYTIESTYFENGVMNVMNINGQLVNVFSINASQGTIELDLAPGKYFIQIRDEKGELFASERIVVLK